MLSCRPAIVWRVPPFIRSPIPSFLGRSKHLRSQTSLIVIWGGPKKGVPPKSSIPMRFSTINHPFGGIRIYKLVCKPWQPLYITLQTSSLNHFWDFPWNKPWKPPCIPCKQPVDGAVLAQRLANGLSGGQIEQHLGPIFSEFCYQKPRRNIVFGVDVDLKMGFNGNWWNLMGCLSQWTGLRENLEQTMFLPSNTGVSCEFAHHPSLWIMAYRGYPPISINHLWPKSFWATKKGLLNYHVVGKLNS